MLKFKANLESNKKDNIYLKGDYIQNDITNLSFRTSSIDVFVTDMPFGKRVGTKADNRVLYPKALKELARVCKPNTGRACLLTNVSFFLFKTKILYF